MGWFLSPLVISSYVYREKVKKSRVLLTERMYTACMGSLLTTEVTLERMDELMNAIYFQVYDAINNLSSPYIYMEHIRSVGWGVKKG